MVGCESDSRLSNRRGAQVTRCSPVTRRSDTARSRSFRTAVRSPWRVACRRPVHAEAAGGSGAGALPSSRRTAWTRESSGRRTGLTQPWLRSRASWLSKRISGSWAMPSRALSCYQADSLTGRSPRAQSSGRERTARRSIRMKLLSWKLNSRRLVARDQVAAVARRRPDVGLPGGDGGHGGHLRRVLIERGFLFAVNSFEHQESRSHLWARVADTGSEIRKVDG